MKGQDGKFEFYLLDGEPARTWSRGGTGSKQRPAENFLVTMRRASGRWGEAEQSSTTASRTTHSRLMVGIQRKTEPKNLEGGRVERCGVGTQVSMERGQAEGACRVWAQMAAQFCLSNKHFLSTCSVHSMGEGWRGSRGGEEALVW